mmetsp:Transcript_123903/g.361860  ORF Transcript_123903/g.361860 Transcript_123903/m.361860 type:complete len:293 (-) Transcript_123903:225-1103(-)
MHPGLGQRRCDFLCPRPHLLHPRPRPPAWVGLHGQPWHPAAPRPPPRLHPQLQRGHHPLECRPRRPRPVHQHHLLRPRSRQDPRGSPRPRRRPAGAAAPAPWTRSARRTWTAPAADRLAWAPAPSWRRGRTPLSMPTRSGTSSAGMLAHPSERRSARRPRRMSLPQGTHRSCRRERQASRGGEPLHRQRRARTGRTLPPVRTPAALWQPTVTRRAPLDTTGPHSLACSAAASTACSAALQQAWQVLQRAALQRAWQELQGALLQRTCQELQRRAWKTADASPVPPSAQPRPL